MPLDHFLLYYDRDDKNIIQKGFAGLLTNDGLIVGGSYRQPNDNPSKEKARKLAIKRITEYLNVETTPRNLIAFFPDITERNEALEILKSLDVEVTEEDRGLKSYKIMPSST